MASPRASLLHPASLQQQSGLGEQAAPAVQVATPSPQQPVATAAPGQLSGEQAAAATVAAAPTFSGAAEPGQEAEQQVPLPAFQQLTSPQEQQQTVPQHAGAVEQPAAPVSQQLSEQPQLSSPLATPPRASASMLATPSHQTSFPLPQPQFSSLMQPGALQQVLQQQSGQAAPSRSTQSEEEEYYSKDRQERLRRGHQEQAERLQREAGLFEQQCLEQQRRAQSAQMQAGQQFGQQPPPLTESAQGGWTEQYEEEYASSSPPRRRSSRKEERTRAERSHRDIRSILTMQPPQAASQQAEPRQSTTKSVSHQHRDRSRSRSPPPCHTKHGKVLEQLAA